MIERGSELAEGFKSWKAERDMSSREFPGLPFYLLHSLSHLLRHRAISLECGYPASSLRERIYAAPDRYGILIYTGHRTPKGHWAVWCSLAVRFASTCGEHWSSVRFAPMIPSAPATFPPSMIISGC